MNIRTLKTSSSRYGVHECVPLPEGPRPRGVGITTEDTERHGYRFALIDSPAIRSRQWNGARAREESARRGAVRSEVPMADERVATRVHARKRREERRANDTNHDGVDRRMDGRIHSGWVPRTRLYTRSATRRRTTYTARRTAADWSPRRALPRKYEDGVKPAAEARRARRASRDVSWPLLLPTREALVLSHKTAKSV